MFRQPLLDPLITWTILLSKVYFSCSARNSTYNNNNMIIMRVKNKEEEEYAIEQPLLISQDHVGRIAFVMCSSADSSPLERPHE